MKYAITIIKMGRYEIEIFLIILLKESGFYRI